MADNSPVQLRRLSHTRNIRLHSALILQNVARQRGIRGVRRVNYCDMGHFLGHRPAGSRGGVLVLLGVASLLGCDRSVSPKARPENPRGSQSQPSAKSADARVEEFASQFSPLWRAQLAKAAPLAPHLQQERLAQKDRLTEPLVIERLYAKPQARSRFVSNNALAPTALRLLRSFRDSVDHGLDPQRYHLDTLLTLADDLDPHAQDDADSPSGPAPSSQPTAAATAATAAAAAIRDGGDRSRFGAPEKAQLKAWLEAATTPAPQGAELLRLLTGAKSPLPSLASAFAAAVTERRSRLDRLARFDLLATDGLAAYARDLRRGNTNPQRLQEKWRAGMAAEAKKAAAKADPPTSQPADKKETDWQAWVVDKLVQDLQGVANDKTLAALLDDLPPRFAQYGRLVKAMKSYRQIAAAGGWKKLTSSVRLLRKKKSKAIRALKARLAVEGHYSGPIDDVRDLALHDAIRSYQRTHQFDDDGRPSRALWRSLNIPVERRMKSIAFALHRWRNSYIGEAPYYVYINIPDFHLEVWQGQKRLTRHRVIVGKSQGRECDEETRRWVPKYATPVQQARIEKLVFAPYWNVTKDIKETEYDPERGKDPLFYEKHGYEIMNDGERREWVRQLPGPGNSLGFVKFIFPNYYSVFVHDTPTKALFNRPIRTFSHGCMRVKDPWDLAKTLLTQDGQWNEPKYRKLYQEWKSMNFHSLRTNWDPDVYDELKEKASELQETVELAVQTPIYVDYLTARVDGAGKVHFLTDVYDEESEWLRPTTARRCIPESVIARTRFAKLLDQVAELEAAAPALAQRIAAAQKTAATLAPKIATRNRRLLKKLDDLADFKAEQGNLAQSIRDSHATLTTTMEDRSGRWGRAQKSEAVKLWRLFTALTSMSAKADGVCKRIEKLAPAAPPTPPENPNP